MCVGVTHLSDDVVRGQHLHLLLRLALRGETQVAAVLAVGVAARQTPSVVIVLGVAQ